MLKVLLSFAALLVLCSGSQADCRSRQAGCQGHTAKATGCVGAQAGCASTQASCYGGHGGLLGRFHPLDRLRNRRHVHSVPSAPMEPPLALPMPKKMSAMGEAQTVQVVLSSGESTMEQQLLDAHNVERRSRGIGTLVLDKALCRQSLEHSRKQSTELQYDRWGRPTCYHGGYSLENVYHGGHWSDGTICERSAQGITDAWINSPGHRRNLLDPKHKTAGFGVVMNQHGTFGTAQFGN